MNVYHQPQKIVLVPSTSATVFNMMYHNKTNSTKKTKKKQRE